MIDGSCLKKEEVKSKPVTILVRCYRISGRDMFPKLNSWHFFKHVDLIIKNCFLSDVCVKLIWKGNSFTGGAIYNFEQWERQLGISLLSWQIIVIHSVRTHSLLGGKRLTFFFFFPHFSWAITWFWENCLSSWTHKIISQPLEECELCIFLKLKSNVFICQVAEQWPYLHTWITF